MSQTPRDTAPRRGIHALASTLPKVTAPIFKSRGFAEAGILTDWSAIVGPYLAGHTLPEKISFPRGSRSAGTLHVVCESAFAPELQHVEPQLLERINGYFGYGALARLRIQHGRVARADENLVPRANESRAAPIPAARGFGEPPVRPLTGSADGSGPGLAPEAATGIEDEALRAALDRLGRAIRGRASQARAQGQGGLPAAGGAVRAAPQADPNARETGGNPGKSPGSR